MIIIVKIINKVFGEFLIRHKIYGRRHARALNNMFFLNFIPVAHSLLSITTAFIYIHGEILNF